MLVRKCSIVPGGQRCECVARWPASPALPENVDGSPGRSAGSIYLGSLLINPAEGELRASLPPSPSSSRFPGSQDQTRHQRVFAAVQPGSVGPGRARVDVEAWSRPRVSAGLRLSSGTGVPGGKRVRVVTSTLRMRKPRRASCPRSHQRTAAWSPHPADRVGAPRGPDASSCECPRHLLQFPSGVLTGRS